MKWLDALFGLFRPDRSDGNLILAASLMREFPTQYVFIPVMIGYGGCDYVKACTTAMDALCYLAHCGEFKHLGLYTEIKRERTRESIMPRWRGFIMVEAVRRAFGLSFAELTYVFKSEPNGELMTPQGIADRLLEVNNRRR